MQCFASELVGEILHYTWCIHFPNACQLDCFYVSVQLNLSPARGNPWLFSVVAFGAGNSVTPFMVTFLILVSGFINILFGNVHILGVCLRSMISVSYSNINNI